MSRKAFRKLDLTKGRSTDSHSHSFASLSGDASVLASILGIIEDAVVFEAPDGTISSWNSAAERMFGYTAPTIIGKSKALLFPADPGADRTLTLVPTASETEQECFETIGIKADGSMFQVSLRYSPIHDIAGIFIGTFTIMHDITEPKRVADALRESELKLHDALRADRMGIWELDFTDSCLRWSQETAEILGLEPHIRDMMREEFRAMVYRDDVAGMQEAVQLAIDLGTPCEYIFRIVRPDGATCWMQTNGRAVFDSHGQPLRLIGTLMEISERKLEEKKVQALNEQLQERIQEVEAQNALLEALATTDVLTGLYNHRALQERLHEEFDRAVRFRTPLSLLMLDVDRFKDYNMAHGHPEGDLVLKKVSDVLRSISRSCDFVARFGGEEFAILLPGAGAIEAKKLAERYRHAVELASQPEQNVTVSIGIATLSATVQQYDALLADADVALYRSKHRGRNCVTYAGDPVDADSLDAEAESWYDDLLHKLLAAQARALAPETEHVREALIQAYDATIASWSRMLDFKDKETEGHSDRVAQMMVRLMRYLGHDEQQVRYARWGAWLHDIGKMAVPDHILHKPGRLSEAEWVIMRQHTTIAHGVLQPIEVLGPAIDIPYCHHEKWDGSGYPRGLRQDEIPILARLFAVIDVYDALTSDRPYRRAWTVERVRAHLRKHSGAHFDPAAVDAFLSMLDAEASSSQTSGTETNPPTTKQAA